nr:MAG TPA: hypothetical protein [Caudoviricetes sp.]
MTTLGFKYSDAFVQFMKIACDRNITYTVHKMSRCSFLDLYELTLDDDADVVGLFDDLRALRWRFMFFGEIAPESTLKVNVMSVNGTIIFSFDCRGSEVIEYIKHVGTVA